MFVLAKHPEVQEKLFQEIKSNIIDTKIEKLTVHIVNSLTYLDAVIKETLRLYTIVPLSSRKPLVTTKIGTTTIPSGTSLLLMFQANHLNEKYFPDPYKFDPSRFNSSITANQSKPYVYQPFASGMRNCVGK